MCELGLETRWETRADQDHLVQQHVEHHLRKNCRMAIATPNHGNGGKLVTQGALTGAHEAIAHPLEKRLEAAVEPVGMHDRYIEQCIRTVQPRHQLTDIIRYGAILHGAGVISIAVIDAIILEPDFIDHGLFAQVAAHKRHHPCTNSTRPA
ncbi:hypothetical protein D3C80_1355690 [compost metagenome]